MKISINKGLIGIVGGMGPEAGLTLSRHIILQTIASNDQEHLPQVLYSTPNTISDRTAYIMGKVKTNPAYRIVKILENLESLGVSLAALACNSAHAPQIFEVVVSELECRQSKLRLLHMIEEVGRFITDYYPDRRKVGILGTTGTYLTRQYDLLNKFGLETVNISEKEQKKLHQVIYHPVYGVKSKTGNISENADKILSDAVISLRKDGAELVVLGCTELSLVYSGHYFHGLPVIDSSVVMARALIKVHSPGKLKPWHL